MKRFFLIICAVYSLHVQAQTCNTTSGNVVIYSNYDGGVLNINCDVNIPNLKIGVCTYENCQINITGPFAGNVTQVLYAGFQGDNDNCNSGVNSTTINGVSSAITSILFAPPGVLSDSNGNSSIICGYSCDTDNQGGCNTASQIVAYFLNQLGGTLHTYFTQYQCWGGTTFDVSDNLCCSFPLPGIETIFSASDPIVCVGQCISFSSVSSGNPTNYTWSFGGAQTSSSSLANPSGICFTTPGTYTTTLTASNATSSDSFSLPITVIDCGLVSTGVQGCTYSNALNYNPLVEIDDQSCQFEECPSITCLGDLNADTVVGVGDLIIFLSLFGQSCE